MTLALLPAILTAVAGGLVVAEPTQREALFFISGMLVVLLITNRWRLDLAERLRWSSQRSCNPSSNLRKDFIVSDIAQLRDSIPVGLSGSCVADATKVLDHLDQQMISFVRCSPFLQLATVDATGQPFVSPKGDAPGYVEVVESEGSPNRGIALRIPDRPGNRLIFGWQNLLRGSGRVGLCLVIPGCETTLRCGGPAVLSRDPLLLEQHKARGLPSTLVLQVQVKYAFFHCAKAYLRSRLWIPQSWPVEKHKVRFGPYFHKNENKSRALDEIIDRHYEQVQKAVAGECVESN